MSNGNERFLAGGDKPRPYSMESASFVGAGFMPARLTYCSHQVAQRVTNHDRRRLTRILTTVTRK